MASTRVLTNEFTFHRPATLQEALHLLRETQGAKVLAGSTDLLIQMKIGKQRPSAVVQILDIPELSELSLGAREARIGAAVRLYRLEEDARLGELFPALQEAVRAIGSVQVRNMATLGGNLCNASPGADTAPPLIAYGAAAEIAGGGGEETLRERLPLEELFAGPGQTVLGPERLLAAVILPAPPEASGAAFRRLGRVSLDIAKISASAYLERRGEQVAAARVAVGSAAPRPVRAGTVEAALEGKPFSAALAREAAERVEGDIHPITDVRSTARYRVETAAVLIRDCLLEAWRRAGGKE